MVRPVVADGRVSTKPLSPSLFVSAASGFPILNLPAHGSSPRRHGLSSGVHRVRWPQVAAVLSFVYTIDFRRTKIIIARDVRTVKRTMSLNSRVRSRRNGEYSSRTYAYYCRIYIAVMYGDGSGS